MQAAKRGCKAPPTRDLNIWLCNNYPITEISQRLSVSLESGLIRMIRFSGGSVRLGFRREPEKTESESAGERGDNEQQVNN